MTPTSPNEVDEKTTESDQEHEMKEQQRSPFNIGSVSLSNIHRQFSSSIISTDIHERHEQS